MITLPNVSYASFPVVDPVIDPPITEVIESASGGFNWQAVVSVSCASLAWSIAGLPLSLCAIGFGIWGITGDKNLKWLGWIGIGLGVLGTIVMIAYYSL